MSDRTTGAAPLLDRWLILLASRLVPPARRPEWLRYWLGGATHWWAFLSERNEPRHSAEGKLREYSRAAARDAWKERFPADSFEKITRKTLHSPLFFLAAIALCICAFA